MPRSRSSSARKGAPLPVLDGLRVVRYAFIRRPIQYRGHSGLFVVSQAGSSKEVGPVPRLAIGQSLRGTREFFLLHCTRTWQVLGAQGGFSKVSQAEQLAERIYVGVTGAWIPTNVTKREAKQFERVIWYSLTCSFCGRIPPEHEDVRGATIFAARLARICGDCVRDLNRQLEER